MVIGDERKVCALDIFEVLCFKKNGPGCVCNLGRHEVLFLALCVHGGERAIDK